MIYTLTSAGADKLSEKIRKYKKNTKLAARQLRWALGSAKNEAFFGLACICARSSLTAQRILP